MHKFGRNFLYGLNLRNVTFPSHLLSRLHSSSVQSLSSLLTLCDPMDSSTLGFPFRHQLPELAQAHIHRVGNATDYLILCHIVLA